MKCSLCGMELGLMIQMKVHERWHKHCKIEKRNTTEGVVEWEN